MNITQIRNATLKIHYHNIKLLTDPWLMPKDFMPGFESAIVDAHKMIPIDVITTDLFSANTPILFSTPFYLCI